MAVVNVTQVSDLLGKRVVLLEDLGGVLVERAGRVTAFTQVAPGSCCDEEFVLEQDDGDVCWYALPEVQLHAVE